MTTIDITFKKDAKPGKRFKIQNYCLTCSDPIPPDKNFCDNDICENNFYDDSALEREGDEGSAEQEELEREERKGKALP